MKKTKSSKPTSRTRRTRQPTSRTRCSSRHGVSNAAGAVATRSPRGLSPPPSETYEARGTLHDTNVAREIPRRRRERDAVPSYFADRDGSVATVPHPEEDASGNESKKKQTRHPPMKQDIFHEDKKGSKTEGKNQEFLGGSKRKKKKEGRKKHDVRNTCSSWRYE